jgi:hypothetical protein
MGEHNCYRSDESECIRVKAYELWEKDGRKPGLDMYYWLLAEKAVKPAHKNTSPKVFSHNGTGR